MGRIQGQRQGERIRAKMTMHLLSPHCQVLLPNHSCGQAMWQEGKGDLKSQKGSSNVKAKTPGPLKYEDRWLWGSGMRDKCCPEAIPEMGPKTEFSHSVSLCPDKANPANGHLAMSNL